MAKHTPYTACANCSAAPDPGERCTCAATTAEPLRERSAADGGNGTFDKEANKAFVERLYNRWYGRKH